MKTMSHFRLSTKIFSEYSSDKRSPLGTMRFGKRSLATYDDDNSIADAAYFNYDKREAADNGEDSIDRNIRSPLGTMRFGKRSDGKYSFFSFEFSISLR